MTEKKTQTDGEQRKEASLVSPDTDKKTAESTQVDSIANTSKTGTLNMIDATSAQRKDMERHFIDAEGKPGFFIHMHLVKKTMHGWRKNDTNHQNKN